MSYLFLAILMINMIIPISPARERPVISPTLRAIPAIMSMIISK